MNSGSGVYFDGETLRRQPVNFELVPGVGLRVTGEAFDRELPFATLRASDRLGSAPRFLYLPNGATLETFDHSVVDQIALAQQRGQLGRLIHFLESHQGIAAAACVAVVAIFASLIYFGPPRLARAVAQRTPATWDARIGQAALAALNSYVGATTLNEIEKRRVQRQLERLLSDVAMAERPRLEFRAFGAGFPNALALPGGVIIVSDELVRLTSDGDEIAAVLAHELAHVEKRHGVQSVLGSSTALLIVTTVTGDLSTLASLAASAPLLILRNGYSRDFEREADTYARDLLEARQIDVKKFSSILLKLETVTASAKRATGYLATHPSTAERIEQFAPLSPAEKAAVLAQGESPPRAVRQSRPVYPPAMRAKDIPGEVVVEFVVDTLGNTQRLRVASSTRREFEQYALRAVAGWKFAPARKEFRAVEMKMRVPIVFNIEEEKTSRPTTRGGNPR